MAMNPIYTTSHKQLAVLVDPEKTEPTLAHRLCHLEQLGVGPDMIILGGSTGRLENDHIIREAHQIGLPVILFPGNAEQLSRSADALMLPVVISSRNPEMLIGQHIDAAYAIRQLGIEVIPLGYILLDGGVETSVQRQTLSQPLSQENIDLIVRTAMAGEILGMKAIYLEAGSGATHRVEERIIRAVREAVQVPLLVGGGIRSRAAIDNAWQAGADIVVIGNMLEQE